MDEPAGRIHRINPFATPEEQRDPVRRLRGRLAAPVTIWTAAVGEERAGLTVSSLAVVDGDPPSVLGLVGPTSDLWDAVQASRALVVHLLEEGRGVLAEQFAGLRPSPGGLFAGLRIEESEWGPVIVDLESRVFCRLVDATEVGYHMLVRAAIERVELGELERPLVYFRGRYRGLLPRPE